MAKRILHIDIAMTNSCRLHIQIHRKILTFALNMETVVSGIRSTGNLHLGNYYGAVTNFLQMQHEHICYFVIADLHAVTTHPTPADLHANVRQVVVEYLAA